MSFVSQSILVAIHNAAVAASAAASAVIYAASLNPLLIQPYRFLHKKSFILMSSAFCIDDPAETLSITVEAK